MNPSQMQPLRLMPAVFTLLSVISQVALARPTEDNQNDGDGADTPLRRRARYGEEELSTGQKVAIWIGPLVAGVLVYLVYMCYRDRYHMRKEKEQKASQDTQVSV